MADEMPRSVRHRFEGLWWPLSLSLLLLALSFIYPCWKAWARVGKRTFDVVVGMLAARGDKYRLGCCHPNWALMLWINIVGFEKANKVFQ